MQIHFDSYAVVFKEIGKILLLGFNNPNPTELQLKLAAQWSYNAFLDALCNLRFYGSMHYPDNVTESMMHRLAVAMKNEDKEK